MTQQNQKNEPKIKQNKKWGKTVLKARGKKDNTMHNHNMPSKEKKEIPSWHNKSKRTNLKQNLKNWGTTTPKIVKKQAVSIAGNDLQRLKEPSLILFCR
jgi:hypothetical protein